jgi:Phosphotriesterase family
VQEGYADRIHLSHDAACFVDFFVGNPFFANEKQDYLLISEQVLPALLEGGVTQEQIDQMMVPCALVNCQSPPSVIHDRRALRRVAELRRCCE